ncbi:hypothetical protein [Erwinia sp. S38]|uniref:hypothetical protein n=1 Tax=Erwinia sp. S38 TaxID=2769338 RepID=UPI00190B57D2|nr:hypothetical protein [Erwinia sp. S38]MBK0000284.1 hypothetical protein [Erwinia sp. S38]
MSEKFSEAMSSGLGSTLFEKYYQMLDKESDKGAVLIASGLFEEALQEIIIKSLYPSTTKKDPLFGGEGSPLSTFGAKIEIAYRIGSINESVRNTLTIFRKLRNEFAHSIYKTSLSESDVKDRLSAIYSSAAEVHASINSVFYESVGKLTQRQEFNVFFASQMMALKIQAEVVEPL